MFRLSITQNDTKKGNSHFAQNKKKKKERIDCVDTNDRTAKEICDVRLRWEWSGDGFETYVNDVKSKVVFGGNPGNSTTIAKNTRKFRTARYPNFNSPIVVCPLSLFQLQKKWKNFTVRFTRIADQVFFSSALSSFDDGRTRRRAKRRRNRNIKMLEIEWLCGVWWDEIFTSWISSILSFRLSWFGLWRECVCVCCVMKFVCAYFMHDC